MIRYLGYKINCDDRDTTTSNIDKTVHAFILPVNKVKARCNTNTPDEDVQSINVHKVRQITSCFIAT